MSGSSEVSIHHSLLAADPSVPPTLKAKPPVISLPRLPIA
jgi:hypothetical protein